MKNRTALLVGIFACVAVASPAEAVVIWRGDFETGDLSQWTKKQAVANDRLQIVTDPVTQGRMALRATVRYGDDPIGASGHRNELVYTGDRPIETERIYKWSTLWPTTYPSSPLWQLFTQWHHEGDNGPPPVEFHTIGDVISLGVDGGDVWSTPLVKGQWHEFVLRIVWSASPERGRVELWFDGVHVMSEIKIATLFPGPGDGGLVRPVYGGSVRCRATSRSAAW